MKYVKRCMLAAHSLTLWEPSQDAAAASATAAAAAAAGALELGVGLISSALLK